jgi:hypothetical protein
LRGWLRPAAQDCCLFQQASLGPLPLVAILLFVVMRCACKGLMHWCGEG